jgi:VWFA-related protein
VKAKTELHRFLVGSCLALIVSTHAVAQQGGPSEEAPPKIEVNVIRVLVPVVVRDRQGRVVDDLKKEDFHVFDDGKAYPVSRFTIEKRPAMEGNAESGARQPAPSNIIPQSSSLPERDIVFLFDDLHLNAENLAQVKDAAAKMLVGGLASSDIAAVISLSGKVNSGLTHDEAKLRQAIMSLQPPGALPSESKECPKIDYYQADLIENKHDEAATADATRQVFDCNPGLDVKYNYTQAQSLADAAARSALNRGRQDIQATYAAIAEFVRRVSTLPGQRMLVLVSPGFLPLEQETRTAESRIIDLAAQSNVIISALDARGLYTTGLNANQRSPGFTTIGGSGGSLQLQSEYDRNGAKMAEDAMGELAEGTGGAFFHNRNDLGAGFKVLTESPACVYVLELALGNLKPDGKYHRLKVKVDRDGLQLQARRGYFLTRSISPRAEPSVDSNEVPLHLVVLDRKNKPVLNLDPKEILVTDGGSPVALNSFRLMARKEKSEHLLTLLFDRPGPIKDALQAMGPSDVNQPGDVADKILKVFPQNGFSFSVLDVQERLQLQHGFTADHKALEQAIRAATQPADAASGATINQPEKELLALARTGADSSGTAVSASDLALDRALFSALSSSRHVVQEQRLQPAIGSLLALVQSQRSITGRKAVIYFSSLVDKQVDSHNLQAVESIIGAANRAGITLYVVDFNRLDHRASELENVGMLMADPSNGSGTSVNRGVKRETANSILKHLAEATGGIYITTEDDLSKAAKQVMQDMTTYYEASYVPAIEEYDGSFRAIAVKPLRAGLTIRTQAGYLALPPRADATLQPFELPLLKILSDPQLPTEVNFRTLILHMEDVPEGSVNSLGVEIPLSSLDLRGDSGTGLYAAHVSMVADIKDKTGSVVVHFSEDVPWRGGLSSVDRSKFGAITLLRHFVAPPGQYVLEAVILDHNSGKAGAQRVPFEIAKAADVPGLSDMVLVRTTEPFSSAEDPSEPLQHGSSRVVPNLSSQLPMGATDVSVFFIAHSDPNAPEPAMLSVQMLKDGKRVEGPPIPAQQVRKARFSSYLATLSTESLKDGVYELDAVLTQGGKTAEARALFTLSGIQPEEASAPRRGSSIPGSASSPPIASETIDPARGPVSPVNPVGPLVITFPADPVQPPPPDELRSILAEASRHAMEYSHSLPNLMCEQVTDRSVDRKGTGQWKHKDRFTELLSYVDHKETRTFLAREHSDPKSHEHAADAGTASFGEFGSGLVGVFRVASKTAFHWKGTGRLGNGTVQVFDYRVARTNSILYVGVNTTTVVGYHGQVFIDSATRGVRRITIVADDIPKSSRLYATSISVDYDYVAINNHDYLLPVAAQVEVSHDRRETDLNRIEFRNFHRFGSTTRILPNYPETKP